MEKSYLKKLWNKFLETGSPSDYVSFKSAERENAKEKTNGKPNNNKGNCFKGNTLSR